jgi:uncharacterized damage-inducible protein DinB
MSRVKLATEQINAAREYTIRLLDATPQAEWFRQPAGGVTHVAWQVGHLAMAQYRLALLRTRGERPDDAKLISKEFQKPFAGQSVPDPDPSKYPDAAEIRAVFDRVHQQVLRELPTLEEASLDKPLSMAHPIAKTPWWSLIWCAHHEAVHAGQIGLLRRLLGHPPLW